MSAASRDLHSLRLFLKRFLHTSLLSVAWALLQISFEKIILSPELCEFQHATQSVLVASGHKDLCRAVAM